VKKEKRTIKFSTLLCSFITYIIALPIQTIVFFIGFFTKLVKLDKLFIFISKAWCKFFFFIIGVRLESKNIELIDKNKHYLIIANHSSYYDIPAIMYFLPNTIWVVNQRFFKVLFFGDLLRLMDSIPIDYKKVKQTIEKINEKTRKIKKHNSGSIAIFPEGTRTLDGHIHKFKRGFLSIWENTKFDLLPITINGTYIIKPKWSFLIFHTKKVTVTFHKPISYEDYLQNKDNDFVEITKNIIEKDYENKNFC